MKVRIIVALLTLLNAFVNFRSTFPMHLSSKALHPVIDNLGYSWECAIHLVGHNFILEIDLIVSQK